MPYLIAAVYVQDPATHEDLILLPGECPAPEIAALVTNPDAWDVHLDAAPTPEALVQARPSPPADGTTGSRGGGAKKASRQPRSAS